MTASGIGFRGLGRERLETRIGFSRNSAQAPTRARHCRRSTPAAAVSAALPQLASAAAAAAVALSQSAARSAGSERACSASIASLAKGGRSGRQCRCAVDIGARAIFPFRSDILPGSARRNSHSPSGRRSSRARSAFCREVSTIAFGNGGIIRQRAVEPRIVALRTNADESRCRRARGRNRP